MLKGNHWPDLAVLRNHPLHATVESLVSTVIAEYPDYRSEDDGYLVLIEPADVDRVLDDLDMPWRLSEAPFEGIILGTFPTPTPTRDHPVRFSGSRWRGENLKF